MTQRLVVAGLTELRAALKAAQGRAPRELTKALKRVGEPVVRAAAAAAPYRSGTLSRSYATSVRGSTASIVSKAPYGAGAEWGKFGKWRGFMRYGGPGRFAWRALEADTELPERLTHELSDVLSANGWFHGRL